MIVKAIMSKQCMDPELQTLSDHIATQVDPEAMQPRSTAKRRLTMSLVLAALLVTFYVFLAPASKSGDKFESLLLGQVYPGGFLHTNVTPCFDVTRTLVIVHSTPGNTVRRDAIRNTWGAWKSRDIRLLFLVGQGDVEVSNDVIIASFEDSPYNQTLKSIAMIDWSSQFCSNIEYLVKVDDDVFVNVDNLRRYLDDITRSNLRQRLEDTSRRGDFIAGNICRKCNAKHQQQQGQFYADVFPDFAQSDYLITGRALPDLFSFALDETWLAREDIFVSGVVARQRVGLSLVHNENFSANYVAPSQARNLITVRGVSAWQQNVFFQCSVHGECARSWHHYLVQVSLYLSEL